MAPVVSTIEIDRPPEDVFAYATDLVRFGEWQKDVVRVELHGGGPLGVGYRFTTTRQLGGVEYKTTQEVTEFSPPSRFAAASVGGPLRAIGTITTMPLDGGRSEEHTSELQSLTNLVCRLLLEKKKNIQIPFLIFIKKKKKK